MISARMPRYVLIAFFVSLLSLLAGCSTVTTKEAMSVGAVEKAQTYLAETAAVSVGGEPRSINIENFEAALVESLLAAGLVREVDNSGSAPYLLSVDFKNVDLPMFGGSFTINIDTTWKVFDTRDRSLLISEEVASTYTGGFEGGVVGVNRMRVATEGAARENIRLGLEKLRAVGKLDMVPKDAADAGSR